MRPGHCNSKDQMCLSQEAEVVHPVIQECYELFQQGTIRDYDLVGIYILTYLIVRKPKAWTNGRLKKAIVDDIAHVSSMKICDAPSTFQKRLSTNFIQKKLKLSEEQSSEFRLVDVFNTLQLSGIKHNADNYINHCMVHWACGSRPVKLMFRIPSPMTVLRQQARGKRVATMFTTIEVTHILLR